MIHLVVHYILSPYTCNLGHDVETWFWFLWNKVWGISSKDGHCPCMFDKVTCKELVFWRFLMRNMFILFTQSSVIFHWSWIEWNPISLLLGFTLLLIVVMNRDWVHILPSSRKQKWISNRWWRKLMVCVISFSYFISNLVSIFKLLVILVPSLVRSPLKIQFKICIIRGVFFVCVLILDLFTYYPTLHSLHI
jgi:hypothetical protein